MLGHEDVYREIWIIIPKLSQLPQLPLLIWSIANILEWGTPKQACVSFAVGIPKCKAMCISAIINSTMSLYLKSSNPFQYTSSELTILSYI